MWSALYWNHNKLFWFLTEIIFDHKFTIELNHQNISEMAVPYLEHFLDSNFLFDNQLN